MSHMVFSILDTMKIVIPHLPSSLVSPSSMDAIKNVARIFPDFHTSCFGFEVALGRDRGDSDFSIFLSADTGRRILADCPKALNRPEWAGHPSWRRIQAFGKEWSDGDSILGNGVPHVWLEFDLEQCRSQQPVPGVFFGLYAPRSRSDEQAEIIAHALNLLMGEEEATAPLTGVSRCLQAMPSTGSVTFVGLMLSRPTRVARLNVRGLGPSPAAEYIQRLGWKSEVIDLLKLFSELAEYVDDLTLALDVGAALEPRLGIELFLRNDLQLAGETRWATFLEYLVGRGLCLPGQMTAALEWPGYSREQLDHELWESVVSRTINHVKLVCLPSGAQEAKAYCAVLKQPLASFLESANNSVVDR